jgi:hypothetical protein
MNRVIHMPAAVKKVAGTAVAATAITAVGFLTVSPPAQAHPMLPVAPPCGRYDFPAVFTLEQSNGDTVQLHGNYQDATGPAVATGGTYGALHASEVAGGITFAEVVDGYPRTNFDILWDSGAIGRYTGRVDSNGFAHGDTYDATAPDAHIAHWDATVPLVCTNTPAAAQPAPAQQPAPPDAQTAAARLGVAVNGPTTLATGMSGTYTVSVSNPGDVSAPVELFISFNGNLHQTGQVTPSGGFDCTVNNYAGGTSSVHCTVGQFGSKATANITVQGQGSAPGAGQLVVNINSSDPAAQFVQKSQQLNVSIT